jgi:hypothetical protein
MQHAVLCCAVLTRQACRRGWKCSQCVGMCECSCMGLNFHMSCPGTGVPWV